jgi:hypothetical protein
MNKLVFLGTFTEVDLEALNLLIRERYRNEDKYLAELYENKLSISLSDFDLSVEIKIVDGNLLITSDDFFTIVDVATILADNYDENFDKRSNFMKPVDLVYPVQ